MANEHYENANTNTEEQHEQQMEKSKSKPHDMLGVLTYSMDSARATLTKALEEVREQHPEHDLGSVIRRFHMSTISLIKDNPLESFNVVLGLIGLAVFDSLTDEDKEALRNDTFDNN